MKWANWVDGSLWPASRLAHTNSFHSFSRLFVCLFSCLVYLRIRCDVYCSIAWRVSKSTDRRSCNLRASKTTKINKLSNGQKLINANVKTKGIFAEDLFQIFFLHLLLSDDTRRIVLWFWCDLAVSLHSHTFLNMFCTRDSFNAMQSATAMISYQR